MTLQDHLGYFFAKVGEVADFTSIKGKIGFANGDLKTIVTLTRKHFMEIPNTLIDLCDG